MITSRRMRWAGHAARMRAKRNAYSLSVESQKERDHQENLDVGRRIIFRWILEKWDGVERIWLRILTSGGLL
jgi:hypothetical protein